MENVQGDNFSPEHALAFWKAVKLNEDFEQFHWKIKNLDDLRVDTIDFKNRSDTKKIRDNEITIKAENSHIKTQETE